MSHQDGHRRSSRAVETASRFELLAAGVDATSIRGGEPVGYQNTTFGIVRCLDELTRGRLTDGESAERIYERIAEAVVIDPFDRLG